MDWSIRLLSDGREVLRVAEKEAKEKRLRIWKVGQPAQAHAGDPYHCCGRAGEGSQVGGP